MPGRRGMTRAGRLAALLNKRGLRDAPETGRRLLVEADKFDLIVSSPRSARMAGRTIVVELGYAVHHIIELDTPGHLMADSMR